MNGGLCPSSSWGCEQEWEIGRNQALAEKTCWVVGAVEGYVKWHSQPWPPLVWGNSIANVHTHLRPGTILSPFCCSGAPGLGRPMVGWHNLYLELNGL